MNKVFITSSILCVFCLCSLMGKEKKKIRATSELVVSVSDTVSRIQDPAFHLSFDQIYGAERYLDEKLLKKIEKMYQKKDYWNLLPILEVYVSQFTIKNFAKDTYLLWHLAELYEELGELKKAKHAYRLALKHYHITHDKHIKDYFIVKNSYDSLHVSESESYVDLKYYYELIDYRKHIDTLFPPRSVLLNMGEDINERGVSDYGPTISSNDEVLLYTKRKKERKSLWDDENTVNEDIYMSKGRDGYWYPPSKFDKHINTACNEGSAYLTRDGKSMFFARCATKGNRSSCLDCMGSCDLYVSYLQPDSSWGYPKNLGSNVNTTAWESHPSVSPSGDTLCFASNRFGGFGLSDIYFTYKLTDSTWAKAKNMGPIINTVHQEVSPFYHPNHPVLYFSSGGQVMNFFDEQEDNQHEKTLDIYKAYKVGNTWSEPYNIGPLVNGKENEQYFSIDSKSSTIFYAKTEEGVEKTSYTTDLYSFPLPMEGQPLATVSVGGKLKDEVGDPLAGIVAVVDMDSGIEIAPKKLRKDGSYNFNLINKKKYLLILQGDDFFRIEELFYLEGDTSFAHTAKKLNPAKITFKSVEFENGKWDILPEMEKDLWDVINFMTDHPAISLKISGHTDSHGDPAKNMTLSRNRAEAIKEFLEMTGFIEPDRITTQGYGDTHPIRVPEVTNHDRELNRRVEFEILKDY
ncbi:MAG: OmpA family protein [Cyclobacteriaceae bacterium]